MTPIEPNPKLCRDLKEAASLLKWAMTRVAQLSEAGLENDAKKLMAIISEFPDTEDKLIAYAKEVKAGQVTRAKPNHALQRDLKATVLNLELSCADLGRIASRLSGPEVLGLMQVIGGLYEEVDRLTALLAEVRLRDPEEDSCPLQSPTKSCAAS
ncbi:hypothetical protein [Pseudomonas taetrolens]|uniref:hypothetical protein n=1 Tax=Pseudomonas taetrolens TaxID=47884 RepID=UPI003F9A169D